jgi:hypothetical protein
VANLREIGANFAALCVLIDSGFCVGQCAINQNLSGALRQGRTGLRIDPQGSAVQ